MKRSPRKPQRIKCPKCGKRTLMIRYYRDGGILYVHTVRQTPLAIELVEVCYG